MSERWDLSSKSLHILAMALMLCDHLWAAVFPSQRWMTCIGRIAFPIFAFLLVEGYFHTGNLKRYAKRLLIFAVISEIPFDIFYSGIPFDWFHQNVLWTFLIGLGGITAVEHMRKTKKRWITVLLGGLVMLGCFLLSLLTFTNFAGFGVLMVFTFYLFRGRKWWCLLGQLAAMYWINVELMGGMCYIITIFGTKYEFVEQGFALLALIPIWLYRGRKGNSSKAFQMLCYWFYPVHCLLLGLYALM